MLLTRKEIDEELRKLGALLVPRMLAQAGNAKAWVEFLERANAIKARAPTDQRELVREKVGELLSAYNLVLPWQTASNQGATTGAIYAFPSGIRIS